MVKGRRHLEILTRIAALRFQRDQAKLAEILAQEANLRRTLQELGTQRRASTKRRMDQDDAAFNAGADVQWHIWVEQRKKALNAQLAQVLAQKMDRQAVLKRSFGQDQAAKRLQTQTAEQLGALQRRRADYES
jgi:hypothetical protein